MTGETIAIAFLLSLASASFGATMDRLTGWGKQYDWRPVFAYRVVVCTIVIWAIVRTFGA